VHQISDHLLVDAGSSDNIGGERGSPGDRPELLRITYAA
jgi:hypothetical protein